METYPEQFPDEGASQTPCYRSKDRFFDAIQDSDRPGFANHEGQPDPETPEMNFVIPTQVAGHGPLRPAGQGRPVVTEEGEAVSRSPWTAQIGEALPVGPDLGRLPCPCATSIVDILADACCSVIAAGACFPIVEPDLAIVAEAQAQQCPHPPMSHGIPDGPTRVDRRRSRNYKTLNSRSHRAPAAFPVGYAAGGGISHSQRPASLMHRRPKPIGHSRPDESRAPHPAVAPIPHCPRHPDRW